MPVNRDEPSSRAERDATRRDDREISLSNSTRSPGDVEHGRGRTGTRSEKPLTNPDGGPQSEVTDGRATRAQQRREQRRTAILAAAKRVFRERGYHGTSVHNIIDEAQIARGTFYLYFNNKREIFAELRDSFLGLIRGSVRRISLAPGDAAPLEQMRANFRRVMTVVLEHEDLAAMMLRDPMAFDPETRVEVEQFFEQIVSMVERAVEVGHALGMARECDRHIIAVAALGGLREILRRLIDRPADAERGIDAGRDGAPAAATRAEEIDRLVDELLAFFVRGVFT